MIEVVTYHSGAPGTWGVAPTVCLVCTDRWVAVFPLGIDEIACPSCGSEITKAITKEELYA